MPVKLSPYCIATASPTDIYSHHFSLGFEAMLQTSGEYRGQPLQEVNIVEANFVFEET